MEKSVIHSAFGTDCQLPYRNNYKRTCKRVVHVKAKKLDLFQMETSVHKDPVQTNKHVHNHHFDIQVQAQC